ncbi:Copia protein, partial [Mucuna pruriens]
MSVMGELEFFLGLQIKKIDYLLYSSNKVCKGTSKKVQKYDEYMLVSYYDANYFGNKIERKSTGGGCYIVGANLVSWAKVKYIIVVRCCSQLLWIKHQLKDYNIFESNIHLLGDNTIIIDLSKNHILHSIAKHKEIKHYFIKDYSM